jgi:hypothetical protein
MFHLDVKGKRLSCISTPSVSTKDARSALGRYPIENLVAKADVTSAFKTNSTP